MVKSPEKQQRRCLVDTLLRFWPGMAQYECPAAPGKTAAKGHNRTPTGLNNTSCPSYYAIPARQMPCQAVLQAAEKASYGALQRHSPAQILVALRELSFFAGHCLAEAFSTARQFAGHSMPTPRRSP